MALRFDVLHPSLADLDLWLVAPDNTSVRVFRRTAALRRTAARAPRPARFLLPGQPLLFWSVTVYRRGNNTTSLSL